MANIRWVESRPEDYCLEPRAPGGKVVCELRREHNEEQGAREHIGRDRLGRWHTWVTTR